MKIVSKKEAMVQLAQQGTCVRKFDSGKYKWTGSQKDFIGKDVPELDSVLAVYVERRSDSHGPYAQLMSVSKD